MADLHLFIYEEINGGLEKRIQEELKEIPNPDNIYVHISSPGGGVYTGWTVGNILASQKAKTVALIEGFCASIATYIALSCDEVQMAETAQFMIHNASLIADGNKQDFIEYAKQLDKIDQDLIKKYVKKTGLSREKIAEMMNEETTLNTEETIRMGFADKEMETLKAVAKFDLKMSNKNEENDLLNKIFDKISSLVKSKNEAEPENITLELEDGAMIFVRSEDGELEGKPVVMADSEGNPTDEPAPDGTHMLRDGRSITVENGVVVSVQESENEEDEEMKKVIEDQAAKIKDLEEQLQAKSESESKAQNELDEVKEVMASVVEEVKNLKKVTVGGSFKVDKPVTQPQDKSVDTAKTETKGGMEGFANYLRTQR